MYKPFRYAEGGQSPAPLIKAEVRSATLGPFGAVAPPKRPAGPSCVTDAARATGTAAWAQVGGNTDAQCADAISAMHEAKVDISNAGSKA